MNLLFQHPSTVSDVGVDGYSIATSCYDGFVRLFNEFGQVLFAEQRATQLQCVAVRNGVVVSDRDISSGLKEGVAITPTGDVIGINSFGTSERILDVDRDGRYGVAKDQNCYDRHTGTAWRVVPVTAGYDKWPMGVCVASDGEVITVDQQGYLRFWFNGGLNRELKINSAGLSVDVSDDGSLIVCTDENRGVSVYNRNGTLMKRSEEYSLVYSAKFLPDRRIVYGTHDGRLCVWDGFSDIHPPEQTPSTTSPTETTKPKGKKGK